LGINIFEDYSETRSPPEKTEEKEKEKGDDTKREKKEKKDDTIN